MKFYWHYHYILGQRQILPDDEIDTTPDKHGRWQLKLKVFVDPIALNNTLFDDDTPIDIAIIHYNDQNNTFKSQILNIDFRGLNYNYVYHENVRTLMQTVEREFCNSVFIFKHLVE